MFVRKWNEITRLINSFLKHSNCLMMVMFNQLNKGKNNKNLRPLQYKKKGKSKKNKVLFGDHHSETGIRHMFFEKNASKSASSVQNCGKSSQSTKSYDKVYNKAIY